MSDTVIRAYKIRIANLSDDLRAKLKAHCAAKRVVSNWCKEQMDFKIDRFGALAGLVEGTSGCFSDVQTELLDLCLSPWPSWEELQNRWVQARNADSEKYGWIKDEIGCLTPKYANKHRRKGYDMWQAEQHRGWGYPDWSIAGRDESFVAHEHGSTTVVVRGRRVRLPKIGWVELAEELALHLDDLWPDRLKDRYPKKYKNKQPVIEDTIRLATIKECAGEYDISFTVDTGIPMPSSFDNGKYMGIDIGTRKVAVTYNTATGKDCPYPPYKPRNQLTKNLRRAQRKLSRCSKGSGRWKKLKQIIQKIHSQIAREREAYLHKISNQIINEARSTGIGAIRIEDVSIGNLKKKASKHSTKKKKQNYNWDQAAPGKLREMIAYKAAWHGIRIEKLDRFYPSSQICHSCGYRHKKLGSKETYTCPECGHTEDRDLNVAKNIAVLREEKEHQEALAGTRAPRGCDKQHVKCVVSESKTLPLPKGKASSVTSTRTAEHLVKQNNAKSKLTLTALTRATATVAQRE